jgi:hypothetical protein
METTEADVAGWAGAPGGDPVGGVWRCCGERVVGGGEDTCSSPACGFEERFEERNGCGESSAERSLFYGFCWFCG